MNFLAQETKGSLYALLSGFLYGLLGYLGMSLIDAHFSIFNMLFWRFLVASILILLVLLFTQKNNTDNPKESLKILFYGGAFYSVSAIMYFFACRYISTGLAMVIFFTYPVGVMALNWVLHKIRPSKYCYAAIALIIIGLALLADLNGLKLNIAGIGCAMIAAIGYACYIIFSKKVVASPLMSTLMVSIGCATTSLILALVDKSFSVPTNTTHWLTIISFGLLCTALPILLMLEALKNISSIKAALLSVLEPVFVVIFGMILLHERVNGQQAFGMITVLAGALITLLSSTKNNIGARDCKPR